MSKPQPPEPVCKAILLCQKTIIEADTEAVSLIGVFDSFGVGDDLVTGSAEAFCQITEAEGEYELTLEIHDLSTGSIIARGEGITLIINDRLMRANVIVPIPAMKFSHTGVFDFVILANGAEIDRQTFNVK
ncbi:MAG: hypothetical protein WD851_01075 [Pirellulales bacterium]